MVLQKNLEAKKHAKFGTILDDFKFRQWISRMNIFKIGQVLDLLRFLPRLAKKFGELCSTNYGDLRVESYPPKSTFLEDYISSPMGRCIPKSLHALENDQALLVHPRRGWGSPLQFFSNGVQNWLKIQCIRRKIFGARGNSLMKLYHTLGGGDNVGTTFGEHRPLKIWDDKKRPKFSTFYDNFRLWLQIFLDWIEISTSVKRRFQPHSFRHWTKNLVNYGPLTLEIMWLMFTYPKP